MVQERTRQRAIQLVAGTVGIAAMVYLVRIGEVGGPQALSVILAVLGALGFGEVGRQQGRSE